MKILTNNVEIGTWYRKELEGGISSNGKSYNITFKKGTTNKLLVFFVGGGFSWNEETASKPITVSSTLRKKEAFYVREIPLWQLPLIHVGILNTKDNRNPFSDWHILTIPYSTADFHIGNNEYPYTDAKGNNKVIHHKGANNIKKALKVLKKLVPETPDNLVIAGTSAGGYGCVAHSPQIKNLYPDCKNILVYADSSYLKSPLWPNIAKEVWKVSDDLKPYIKSDDLMTDLFHYANSRMPSHTVFLHFCSVGDAEIVKFMNKMNHEKLSIDSKTLQAFYDDLTHAVGKLKKEIPNYHYFLTDHGKDPKNGTTPHTFVATAKLFYGKIQAGMSIANWLTQACEGKPLDIGIEFVENNTSTPE